MRVGTRTTLAMLLVAGVPLAVAGWSATQLATSSLTARASDLHETNARLLADRIADGFRGQLRSVQLAAAAIDLGSLDREEKLWALRLVFRQIPWASAVVLLNEDGSQAAGPVYLSRRASDAELADRPTLTGADVDRFGDHLPFSLGKSVGSAIGPPYVASDHTPRASVAVRTSSGHVLAVELSLVPLVAMMSEHRAGANSRAFVVDSAGKVVLAEDPDAVAEREDRSAWSLVRATLKRSPATGRLDHPALGESLGAGAAVPDLGWAVIVAEPEREALAAARSLVRYMLIWLLAAVVAAIALGVLISRAVVRPIRALGDGALAIEHGDLGHRIAGTKRADELGDLARAFNKMATEVERWNRELEQRVEDKTRELKESHELLTRAQKMAAVGQLGAGVAHEINNPLTTVLGNAQLMMAGAEPGSPEQESLQVIESQAKRIQEIVAQLSKLTADAKGDHVPEVDLRELARRALAQAEEKLASAGIEVVTELAEDVPLVACSPDPLLEALSHLIDNACNAMIPGGTLTVVVEARDGQLVLLRVRDTGSGIPKEYQSRIFEPFYTTRLGQRAKGLGLPRVNQILEAHNGTVTVESEPDAGSTFTLMLPAVLSRSIA